MSSLEIVLIKPDVVLETGKSVPDYLKERFAASDKQWAFPVKNFFQTATSDSAMALAQAIHPGKWEHELRLDGGNDLNSELRIISWIESQHRRFGPMLAKAGDHYRLYAIGSLWPFIENNSISFLQLDPSGQIGIKFVESK